MTESILIKFGTSTPWVDAVIDLKWHPNWFMGLEGGGVRNYAYPIDFAIGFYYYILRYRIYARWHDAKKWQFTVNCKNNHH